MPTSDLAFDDWSDGVNREWDLYLHNTISSAPGMPDLLRVDDGDWGITLSAQDEGMLSNGDWLTMRTPASLVAGDTGAWDVYTLQYHYPGRGPSPERLGDPNLVTLGYCGGSNGGTGTIDLWATVSDNAVTVFQSSSTLVLPPGGDANGPIQDVLGTSGIVLFVD